MGYFISLLGKNWIKEWQFKRGEKYYSNLIKRLKEDLTTAQRTDEKAEIKKEIITHQKTLDKLRADNIKIIID